MSEILDRVSSNFNSGSHSEQNVSDTERLVSLLGGGALTIYGLVRKDTPGAALAALGSVLVWRGTTGHCDIYHALGVTTASEIEPAANVSVPYGKGIRVDRSITIGRPPAELFQFWRTLENLPQFMGHLKSVTRIDDKRSHWVTKAPIGRMDWEAEIINEIENELIGWRSVEGSAIPNAGSVRFSPALDGGATRVDVELQYDPPAGRLGAAFAKLFHEEPAQQIDDDLRRLKQLLETGEATEGD